MTERPQYQAYFDEVRVNHHITVKQVCDFVGFSETTYQRIRRGEASPTVTEFCRWCSYLYVLPGAGLEALMQANYFPLTTAQNRVLKHLREDVQVLEPAALRAELTTLGQRTHQSDFQLLLALLDLRCTTDPDEQQTIATAVATQLQARHFWASFEIQCFLVLEPFLSWPVISHCMARYLAYPKDKGKGAFRFSYWYEPLAMGYIQAAAKTAISENVRQALQWVSAGGRRSARYGIDTHVWYALSEQLIPCFEAATTPVTAITAVVDPVLATLTALAGAQPVRLTGRLKRVKQLLVTGAPYHHDRRPRRTLAPWPDPDVGDGGIGARFDRLRQARHVSIKDLCALTGFSRTVYRRFCAADAEPRIDELCRALDCLHVELWELLIVEEYPVWPDLDRRVFPEILAAESTKVIPESVQTDLAKTQALAAETGNPFFHMVWLVMMRTCGEITDGDAGAQPYAARTLALLLTFDEWHSMDYYTLEFELEYADLATAHRVMKKLIRAMPRGQFGFFELNFSSSLQLWEAILVVAFKTQDPAAVRSVTQAIRRLHLPANLGSDELLWPILQTYCRSVERAVAMNDDAPGEWQRLEDQLLTLTSGAENWPWRLVTTLNTAMDKYYFGRGQG
ncbi:helix-turn-helix domain-containing protein [Lacticaseibacillus absianus]|uniref:helix-turn-helix domain-containing protein n=1 Tax=Lacticaseibacillus absianus TaxID=2729623 RepID=UPI0015C9A247|nr:helix-turn-helix domain-containing protein [Lacticaseibacillus absianus]